MDLREFSSYQETKKKRKDKECKTLLREKQQEIEAREQIELTHVESIKEAVTEFPLKEGQEDADIDANVACMSQIATDLRKQVEELQPRKIPSTPLEVLEEHNKIVSKVVARINQGEKICTEAIESIFAMWKALLED